MRMTAGRTTRRDFRRQSASLRDSGSSHPRRSRRRCSRCRRWNRELCPLKSTRCPCQWRCSHEARSSRRSQKPSMARRRKEPSCMVSRSCRCHGQCSLRQSRHRWTRSSPRRSRRRCSRCRRWNRELSSEEYLMSLPVEMQSRGSKLETEPKAQHDPQAQGAKLYG